MPTCCDCGQELGKAAFAKSQLKKGPNKRRCLGCAADADYSASTNCDEARSCWICLCDDHSREDPIVRDCACRGTAGYSHVRCLVQSATSKTESMTEDFARKGRMPNPLGAHMAGGVVNPWEECVTCQQPYSNPSRSRTALADAACEKFDDANAIPLWRKVALQALASARDGAGDHAGARVIMERYVELLRGECDACSGGDRAEDKKASRCDLVYAMCNLALAYEKTGDLRAIPPLLEEGLQCLDGLGGASGGADACRARVLVMYGSHAIETNNAESAVEYLSEAIELMRTTNPDSLNLSNELWRCGHLRFHEGEIKRGVGEMTEAMEIHERLSGSTDKVVTSRRSTLAGLVEMARPIATGRCLVADRNGMISPATAKLGPKVDILRFLPLDMAYAVKDQQGGESVSVRSVKEVRLETGTHVLLHGLPARYKMDGCCGIVDQYVAQLRAYNVSLNGQGMTAQVSSVQCYAAKPSTECCLK